MSRRHPNCASVARALDGKSFFYDTTLPPKPTEANDAVKAEPVAMQEPVAAPLAALKSSLPLKKRTAE